MKGVPMVPTLIMGANILEMPLPTPLSTPLSYV